MWYQISTEAENSDAVIPRSLLAFSVRQILIYAQVSDMIIKKPKNIRGSPQMLHNIDCARSPKIAASDAKVNLFGILSPDFAANSKQFCAKRKTVIMKRSNPTIPVSHSS